MGGQGPKPFFDPSAAPSSLLKPNFLGGSPMFQGLEGFPRPPVSAGDLHQALGLYHEELARLQQSAMASVMKDREGETRRLASATPTESEAGEEAAKPCLSPPALPLKLGAPQHKPPFPFPPEAGGQTEASGGQGQATTGTGSPLQRMASITNSLMTSPPSVSFGSPSSNRSRTALPPITQQQFDR